MKPVLTVDGKQLDVYALFYREGKLYSVTTTDDKGLMVSHHYEDIDFDKCLHFEGRYNPVFDAIDSLIILQQKEVQDLATQIADGDTPYPDTDLVKKRNNLKQRTFGLMDAQDIVSEFMEDDVDLSGGEEVE